MENIGRAMVPVALMGIGRLGTKIADALTEGKAPRCRLTGIFARDPEKTAAAAARYGCFGCTEIDRLIALQPSYVIEASKPEAVKAYVPALLEAGISVISLSTGAFADPDFLEICDRLALEHGARVYLASGCLGGFDLAGTMAAMGGLTGTAIQFRAPKRPDAPPTPMDRLPETFAGTALEGFALSPAHLNIVIAAALACGGPEHSRFEIRPSENGKSSFGLDLANDATLASVRIEANSFDLIAMSAVARLDRLTRGVTF